MREVIWGQQRQPLAGWRGLPILGCRSLLNYITPRFLKASNVPWEVKTCQNQPSKACSFIKQKDNHLPCTTQILVPNASFLFTGISLRIAQMSLGLWTFLLSEHILFRGLFSIASCHSEAQLAPVICRWPKKMSPYFEKSFYEVGVWQNV